MTVAVEPAAGPRAARLVVEALTVEYRSERYAVRALDGLDLRAEPGELVVLLGPSGSGKTTLLSCLGGILSPTSGSILVGDVDVTALRGRALDAYRARRVGFIFQAFNLIPSLDARENIAVPLMLGGTSRRVAFARADELLERVGLTDRARHRPAQLSGGQQQRVAIARGLAHEPALLLADEPTANLDHVQAEEVIALLRELRDGGRMIVVSTHDPRLVPVADRVVDMTAGPVDGATARHADLSFPPGAVIFRQGDRSDVVYVIREGSVVILRELLDGGSEPLNELGPGQYFGELGAILGFPRSATARAGTDPVTVSAYSPAEFRRTFDRWTSPGPPDPAPA